MLAITERVAALSRKGNLWGTKEQVGSWHFAEYIIYKLPYQNLVVGGN